MAGGAGRRVGHPCCGTVVAGGAVELNTLGGAIHPERGGAFNTCTTRSGAIMPSRTVEALRYGFLDAVWAVLAGGAR